LANSSKRTLKTLV